jgi:hypothetical protein
MIMRDVEGTSAHAKDGKRHPTGRRRDSTISAVKFEESINALKSFIQVHVGLVMTWRWAHWYGGLFCVIAEP